MKVWSREEMFQEPRRDFSDDPPQFVESRFTPQFLRELERETNWQLELKSPLRITREGQREVGLGLRICPLCNDTKVNYVPKIGQVTGIRMLFPVPCICKLFRQFWRTWQGVDERFAEADLNSLEPRVRMSLSKQRQREIIEKLQASPNDSYFLCGPPGTGKTHFATALYRKAVWDSVEAQFARATTVTSVWRISATRLLQEHSEWNRRDTHEPSCDTPAPSLTVNMIKATKAADFRPRLFLDEIDKVAMTSAKASKLVEVVDAIYSAKGQLVTTSNKTYAELSKSWDRDVVGTLVRRFGLEADAHIITFFAKSEETTPAPVHGGSPLIDSSFSRPEEDMLALLRDSLGAASTIVRSS